MWITLITGVIQTQNFLVKTQKEGAIQRLRELVISLCDSLNTNKNIEICQKIKILINIALYTHIIVWQVNHSNIQMQCAAHSFK